MTDNFFKLPKLFFIISAIKQMKEPMLTDIQLATKITYSHIVRMKDFLVEKRLIESQKTGRTVFVKLTNKGETLFDKYKEILILADTNEKEMFGELILEEEEGDNVSDNNEGI